MASPTGKEAYLIPDKIDINELNSVNIHTIAFTFLDYRSSAFPARIPTFPAGVPTPAGRDGAGEAGGVTSFVFLFPSYLNRYRSPILPK